jgi:hypothetical protein
VAWFRRATGRVRDAFRVTQPGPGVAPRLWVLPGLGLLVVLVYAVTHQSAKAFGVASAIGVAALAFGGLMGFLFGIPRTLTSEAAPGATAQPNSGAASVHSNTNLEQISDWLTKIIGRVCP